MEVKYLLTAEGFGETEVDTRKGSRLLAIDCIFFYLRTVGIIFEVFDGIRLSESEFCQIFVPDDYMIISSALRPIVVELIFRICVWE